MFVLVHHFFFTFKTMFIYFCIRICMTLFWLPFFFSQDSLKNQILDLKRFPPTILGMQEENVWLALFCWFAPASRLGKNCTSQFQLEDRSVGLWRSVWPNIFYTKNHKYPICRSLMVPHNYKFLTCPYL